MNRSVLFGLGFLAMSSLDSSAQYSHRSTVHDGFGDRSTGGPYTHWSSGAQPGGIRISWAGATANFAGYLQTFAMQPGKDTDGDGLPDEVDLDNDNDGLADVTELEGTGFSPNTVTDHNNSDSDGDGMSDGVESLSGSNPNNSNLYLRIVQIAEGGGGRQVFWQARGNHERKYVVKARTNLLLSAHEVIFSNTVGGGVAPWYEVTNSVTDATAVPAEFYHVEVVP
ncbi:MAG: thrombospondin type 3 repeat-containing protein [Kiritimatiellae bacterium]|nr:thrombospondin type 3 repeat-containing protein [Kiritimatiellia bacterium]MDW8458118.1 hypothetical protein [Verrucomicrobiota bacterium]